MRKCTGYKGTPSIYDFYDNQINRTRNAVLEKEVQQQRDDDIFTIPTIIINNEPYRGGYTCPHPPQLASCGVLSAVCSAYKDGAEPPACRTDYCWDFVDDCGSVRWISPKKMSREMLQCVSIYADQLARSVNSVSNQMR